MVDAQTNIFYVFISLCKHKGNLHATQIILPILHFDFSSKLDGFSVLLGDYENIFSKTHHHIRNKHIELFSTQNPLRFHTKRKQKTHSVI